MRVTAASVRSRAQQAGRSSVSDATMPAPPAPACPAGGAPNPCSLSKENEDAYRAAANNPGAHSVFARDLPRATAVRGRAGWGTVEHAVHHRGARIAVGADVSPLPFMLRAASDSFSYDDLVSQAGKFSVPEEDENGQLKEAFRCVWRATRRLACAAQHRAVLRGGTAPRCRGRNGHRGWLGSAQLLSKAVARQGGSLLLGARGCAGGEWQRTRVAQTPADAAQRHHGPASTLPNRVCLSATRGGFSVGRGANAPLCIEPRHLFLERPAPSPNARLCLPTACSTKPTRVSWLPKSSCTWRRSWARYARTSDICVCAVADASAGQPLRLARPTHARAPTPV